MEGMIRKRRNSRRRQQQRVTTRRSSNSSSCYTCWNHCWSLYCFVIIVYQLMISTTITIIQNNNNNNNKSSSSSSSSSSIRYGYNRISQLLLRILTNNNNNNKSNGRLILFMNGVYGIPDVNKDIPNKVDDGSCATIADRYNNLISTGGVVYSDGSDDTTTTTNNNNNDGSSSSTSSSLLSTDNTENLIRSCDEQDDSFILPENGVKLTLYYSLPAYGDSAYLVASWVATSYLRDFSWAYNVTVDDIGSFLTNSTWSALMNPQTQYNANLAYYKTYASTIRLLPEKWWWRYELAFTATYGTRNQDNFNPSNLPPGSNITDPATLKRIEDDLYLELAKGLTILEEFNLYNLSGKLFGLTIEDPQESDTPFEGIGFNITEAEMKRRNQTTIIVDGGTYPPTIDTAQPFYPDVNNPSNTLVTEPGNVTDSSTPLDPYATQLDPQQWDWRRYLGLILFTCTVIISVLLINVASIRQHRRFRKELWGNLGTEEGMAALLQTAWKRNGDKLQVYNKKPNWGYRDDDSMLMGGYEQKVEDCYQNDDTSDICAPVDMVGGANRDAVTPSEYNYQDGTGTGTGNGTAPSTQPTTDGYHYRTSDNISSSQQSTIIRAVPPSTSVASPAANTTLVVL